MKCVGGLLCACVVVNQVIAAAQAPVAATSPEGAQQYALDYGAELARIEAIRLGGGQEEALAQLELFAPQPLRYLLEP